MPTTTPPGHPFDEDDWSAKFWQSLSSEQRENMNQIFEDAQKYASEAMAKVLHNMAPQLESIALHLDYDSLFLDLDDLSSRMFEDLQPTIEKVFEEQREAFSEIFTDIREVLDNLLPPNWRGEDVPIPDNIEDLLIDEGLPLGWVPPKDVLIDVFGAATPEARQQVLETNLEAIVNACRMELDIIRDPDLQEYVHFAYESIEALRADLNKSSQALSTNLLDTILRHSLDKHYRHSLVTDQNTRPALDDYPMRVAIVIGGIWGAHSRYYPRKGDDIPSNFSRHASAHAVSFRQYSRLNALIAVMHVVGLLKVLEQDLKG